MRRTLREGLRQEGRAWYSAPSHPFRTITDLDDRPSVGANLTTTGLGGPACESWAGAGGRLWRSWWQESHSARSSDWRPAAPAAATARRCHRDGPRRDRRWIGPRRG